MSDEWSTFKFGGVTYPLAVGSPNALLLDADPALYHALAFFTWCLDAYLGPRLLAEASSASATEITAAVNYATPWDPVPYLMSEQVKFPLLAMYRKSGKLLYSTQNRRADESEIELLYVLPPLLPSQRERLGPILNAARVVLDNRANHGADPDYTPPGGTLGQSVWEVAGIKSFGFTGVAFGDVPWSNDLFLPAITMTATLTERSEYVDAAWEAWTSGYTQIDLKPPADTQIDEFIVFNEEIREPELTTVSPATGTYAGGTTLTLTGLRFLNGARVFIGDKEATSVTFVSGTSLQAVTPEVTAVGSALDVTVINPDGREATKADAFTYV